MGAGALPGRGRVGSGVVKHRDPAALRVTPLLHPAAPAGSHLIVVECDFSITRGFVLAGGTAATLPAAIQLAIENTLTKHERCCGECSTR